MRHTLKIVSFLILGSHAFAQNNVQGLIDSGQIKNCFMDNGILYLADKALDSLQGLENVPDATSITFIDASRNHISELGGCWFQHFPNLTQLWLNDNQLQDISALSNYPGLENLRELHCMNNKLQELDLQQLYALPMLYILNVGFNKIKLIKPKKTWGLNNLEILYLNNNNLDTLPPYVFSACPNLQALYLQDNAIKTLEPDCLAGLSTLRLLFLQNNALSIMPSKIFNDLHNLHILYLGNNTIKTLEKDWAAGLDLLDVLDLSRNNLDTTDVKNSEIEGLKNLKNIYL